MSVFPNQPPQVIPNDQKTPEWYLLNARYIVSNYNNYPNSWVQTDSNREVRLRPIDEMIENLAFYMSRQENKIFNFATKDENNCDLPVPYVRGGKLASLIDFMLGKFVETIQNMNPTVQSTSKAAVNKKTELLSKMLLKFELRDMIEELQDISGVEFNPVGNKDREFEMKEDIFRFMEKDYKEQAEEYAMRLAEDIMIRNRFVETYKQAAFNVLYSGICGIIDYVENGKVWQKVIPSYNLIWDNSVDDEFNHLAKFAGYVEWLTPSEILANNNFNLSAEAREELSRVTADTISSIFPDTLWYTGTFKWFRTLPSKAPRIAVFRGFWIGSKDLRYRKGEDPYGKTRYSKLSKEKKRSKYWTSIVHKVTVIGNKYVVESGEDNNIVRNQVNPSDSELPIKIFIPNMVMGENRSIVSRLRNHQVFIDYLSVEITKMLIRNKGKVYIINKHKLGSATSQELLNDFERIGLHVSDGNATGEDMANGENRNVVETVDMTLDPNVQRLVELRREEERLMEEIVNISKIALGQQSSYVGAKTQAGTISQTALGTLNLYEGFVKFIENSLQHAINQYKLSLVNEPETEIPLVGTKGRYYMQQTKDIRFEEFQVWIVVKDYISEQARERLLMVAQAMAQNQQIDMIDYIKVEQCRSYSELMNELEYSIKKKKREAMQAQAMQQLQQEAMQQQALQAQQQQEALRQQGANYRTEVTAGEKTNVEEMKLAQEQLMAEHQATMPAEA